MDRGWPFSEKPSPPQSELLAIYLFSLRTGEMRKLTSPPPDDAGDWFPKFSPDGRSIEFMRVSGFWSVDIYTAPVAGGEPLRVTWERRGIWGHAWTADGKSLIVSCQRDSTIFGLWRYSLASADRPERIIQGGVDAITPTTSWKTKRLAWVNQTQDANIYRISAEGGEAPARFIESTLRDQDPAYSLDGRVAFVSDRSGSREIWLARADGTSQKRITDFNGPDVGDLQWSPDGRRLAFWAELKDVRTFSRLIAIQRTCYVGIRSVSFQESRPKFRVGRPTVSFSTSLRIEPVGGRCGNNLLLGETPDR